MSNYPLRFHVKGPLCPASARAGRQAGWQAGRQACQRPLSSIEMAHSSPLPRDVPTSFAFLFSIIELGPSYFPLRSTQLILTLSFALSWPLSLSLSLSLSPPFSKKGFCGKEIKSMCEVKSLGVAGFVHESLKPHLRIGGDRHSLFHFALLEEKCLLI